MGPESASREIALGVDCSMPWMETLFAPPMWTKSQAEVIHQMRSAPARLVGFKLVFSYFFLNYRNVAGPEELAWCCAFPRQALERHTPEHLRYGIRNGSIAAEQIENAGAFFIPDRSAGIKEKICSLFPSGIQIRRTSWMASISGRL